MKRKLYVQAWTAPVVGAIEMDEEQLRSIHEFRNIKPMIPMLTKINDEYKFVETHLTNAPSVSLNEIEEMEEVLAPWRD